MSSRLSSSVIALGLNDRADFPPATSVLTPYPVNSKNAMLLLSRLRILTPVVLLLLMVVPQLPFPLRRHASFRLHHLVCLIRSWSEALVGIVALHVRSRVRAYAVVIADGVVPLRTAAHSGVFCLESVACPVRRFTPIVVEERRGCK